MGLPLAGKKVGVLINYLGEARPERYCRISSFLSFAKPCGLEEAGEEGRWWILWGKREKQWWLQWQWYSILLIQFNSIVGTFKGWPVVWTWIAVRYSARERCRNSHSTSSFAFKHEDCDDNFDAGTHTRRHCLPYDIWLYIIYITYTDTLSPSPFCQTGGFDDKNA